MDLQSIGRLALAAGIALAVLGGALILASRLGLGSLPGDLRFGGEGWSCFVPITTSVLLSLLFTLLLNIVWRLFK